MIRVKKFVKPYQVFVVMIGYSRKINITTNDPSRNIAPSLRAVRNSLTRENPITVLYRIVITSRANIMITRRMQLYTYKNQNILKFHTLQNCATITTKYQTITFQLTLYNFQRKITRQAEGKGIKKRNVLYDTFIWLVTERTLLPLKLDPYSIYIANFNLLAQFEGQIYGKH